MLDFKRVEPDSFNILRPCFQYEAQQQKYTRQRICTYAPGSVYMWAEEYNMEYAAAGESVIFSSVHHGKKAYYYPIGKNKEEALRLLAAHIGTAEKEARLFSVGEREVAAVAKVFIIDEASAPRDQADYLYLKSAFENPSGRRHHKRKNLINRFALTHPDACFKPLTPELLPTAAEYYKSYSLKNPLTSSVEEGEYRAVTSLLERFPFDVFSGGFLMLSGVPVGITIGEAYGDTVYVHVEKAEKELAGAYQTLSREYLLSLKNPELKYVNREEDLGLPGLRRSKTAYCPEWLEYKYSLKVRVE